MEFWGAEVKPGTPLKVAPEEDNLIHISQATLDCKGKMGESVVLTVTVDKKKFVIGTLSQEKFPQISFDLVFEKEFELSHNCTKGSVHFIGYRSPNIEQEEDDFFSGSDEEEEVPEAVPANGNAGAAASNVVKADSKPKAKPAEVKPESDDDEDDSDEEDESDDDDDSEKGMDVDEDDSDDDEDSEDEEEEETPKKPEPNNKKRPNESASKTPVSGMKAKPAAAPAATPQKTEEKKKRGHTATPHPAKKGGKSPVNTNQSPKSGGQSSSGNKKKKKQSKKEDKPVKSDRFPEPAKKIIVKTSAVKMGPKRVRLSMKKTSEVAVIDESSSSSSMNNDFNKVKTFDIRGVTETAAK